MHPASDSSWTIRWHPSKPPRSACLWRAVLLSGSLTVVLDAVLTLSAPWYALTFVLALALFGWGFCLGARRVAAQASEISALQCCEDRVIMFDRETPTPVSIAAVKRHRGALTLTLRDRNCPTASRCVTIWQDNVGKEAFRRLSVLCAWHAENAV